MKYRMKRHAVVQPQDQSYCLIPLTQGQNAIVDSSDFKWLNQWNWSADWSEFTKSFYARRREYTNGRGTNIRMHRIILDCDPDEEGDHKNGDTLDNRRQNLRKCTRPQNRQNSRMGVNNTSGFKGVCWHSRDRVWNARIGVDGKRIHLGYFSSIDDAVREYKKAAKLYHGKFARL